MHSRVAILGDIGGHVHTLRAILEGLGVHFHGDASTLRGAQWRTVGLDWPEGLHVVQVGDLIHRGPDSTGVLMLVDTLLSRGVWTQVVGNHEQLYVDTPVFAWPESLEPAAVELLRSWWREGRMVPGAAIEEADGNDWLITHAGLTQGFWEHGLGSPSSARGALGPLAEAADDGALWFPGAMLTGTPDWRAGPVWADAGSEVYPSWLSAGPGVPFHQAHGHSSAYHWAGGRWRAEPWIRPALSLDAGRRHLTFTVGDRRVVGVDPGHLREPAPVSAALLVDGVVVQR